MVLGDFSTAETLLKQGRDACAGASDDEGLCLAVQVGALLAKHLGKYQKAKADILDLLENDDLTDKTRAGMLGYLGILEQDLNNYEAAKAYLTEGLAISKALKAHEDVVVKLLNLGTLELNTGHMEKAETYYQESLELAEELSIRNHIPVLLHNLANIASKQDKHLQAKQLACQALQLVQESAEKSKESGMLATLSWISLHAGSFGDATTYIKRSLEIAFEIGDEPSALTALLRYAELATKLAKKQKAADLLHIISNHKSALGWTKARALDLLKTLPEPLQHNVNELPALNECIPQVLET